MRRRLVERERGRLIEKMKRHFRVRRCMHPAAGDSCNQIIDAHTISRAAALASLADSGNHVLSFHPMAPHSDSLAPQRIGLRKASTFRGMCQLHDSLFAAVDKEEFSARAEQCAQIAFRSVALDVYKKLSHVAFVEDTKASAFASPDVREISDFVYLEGARGAARALDHLNPLAGLEEKERSMLPYSDPTDTDFLASIGALDPYPHDSEGNPDRLPVGFSLDAENPNGRMLGFTCAAVTYGANVTHTFARKGSNGVATPGGVVIESLLPNPVGSDRDAESVTLRNDGAAAESLVGWVLRDRSALVWSLSGLGTIAPGATARIERNGMAMSLNNDGDEIALLDAAGAERDRFAYGAAAEGAAIQTGH